MTQSKFILVGHSKNDQLESFILNLFRGSGPIGLLTLTKKRLNYFPQFRCFSEKNNKYLLLINISKLIEKYLLYQF